MGVSSTRGRYGDEAREPHRHGGLAHAGASRRQPNRQPIQEAANGAAGAETTQADSAVQVGSSKLSEAEGKEELPSRRCVDLAAEATAMPVDLDTSGISAEMPEDPEHRKDDQMSPATAALLAQSTKAAATQQILLDMPQHEQDELLNFSG